MTRGRALHGVVVPHASGARVVVSEVRIESAWRGVLEGVPGEKFFASRIAHASGRWPGRVARTRPIAHPPLDENQAPAYARSPIFLEQHGVPAPHAPRWIVSADADVLDPRGDVEQRALTFAWFTNDAFALSLEELLLSGVHDIPLDGDVQPMPPDAKAPWLTFTTHDGARVHPESFNLRVALDAAPHQALAAQRGFVHLSRTVNGTPVDAGDAPVLACVELDGPAVEGPRNPNPVEYYASMLKLAWVAPAPGATPLTRMLAEVLWGVAWHELATPSLGD